MIGYLRVWSFGRDPITIAKVLYQTNRRQHFTKYLEGSIFPRRSITIGKIERCDSQTPHSLRTTGRLWLIWVVAGEGIPKHLLIQSSGCEELGWFGWCEVERIYSLRKWCSHHRWRQQIWVRVVMATVHHGIVWIVPLRRLADLLEGCTLCASTDFHRPFRRLHSELPGS